MQTKRSRHRPGESKVHYVTCRDGAGQTFRHRVKLTSKGRLALLDHAHGEPEQTLCLHRLAGAAPSGCCLVLARLQDLRPLHMAWGRLPPQNRPTPDAVAFMDACVAAANGVRMARSVLRAQAPFVAQVEHNPKRPVWVVSQQGEVVRAIATNGEPARFMLWSGRRPYVASTAGFVKVGLPWGAIIWDAGFPGISQLLSRGDERGTPGRLALLRLTDQLLRGWRGVLKAQG